MKKFLILIVVLQIAVSGCQKLCACSPVLPPDYPAMSLVIQNEAKDDLLDEDVEGFISKDDIQIFGVDKNGKQVDVLFSIRPPFTYEDIRFEYHTIVLARVYLLAKDFNSKIFIRVRESDPYELILTFNGDDGIVKELLIDDVESPQVEEEFTKGSPIFFLTNK